MPLTDDQRDAMKTLIDARRTALTAEIRGDLARFRTDTYGAIAGEVPDSGDQAMAALVADTDNAETNRDLRELRDLDAAMERLLDGSYGCCATCGDDIPIARLQAYPGANRCVVCQTHHERTHGHPAEPRM